MKASFISLLLLLASPFAMAEQKQVLGDWEVHYSAFISTFIPADIASTYQLKRSGSHSILSITVLEAKDPAHSAQDVMVSGTAKNLIGQQRPLEFRKISEGDSIYYLAHIRHSNEETFRFEIDISQGQQQQQLKFQQTFYVE